MNWTSFVLLVMIAVCHSRCAILHIFVCPILTCLAMLYISYVDYDYTMQSVYYSNIVGIVVTYFILIVFNESWIISTLTYTPLMSYYMYKTGNDLLKAESTELWARCIFCAIIYAIIGYRVETLTKQSFMGRESSEKAFHRWMKIFETFPEGIALIRNNYILCGNRALSFILNVGMDRSAEDDPLYNLLKQDLKNSVVRKWVKNNNETKGGEMSVWTFLMNNEAGAIFQLLPNQGKVGKQIDDYLNTIPKYVTLNQVNVKIAGGTDKLLVIRDVTSIVMNEQIMETKKEMSKLTDNLMTQVNDMSVVTTEKLKKLDGYVQDQGQQLMKESMFELQKIDYRIKDFKEIYDISENKFNPNFEQLNVKKTFEDISKAASEDVKNKYMEVNLIVEDDVPDTINSDYQKIRQVVMNLFNQSVHDQQRGFVKLVIGFKESGASFPGPHITCTLENSKFVIKPKEAQRLNQMSQEVTFSKILNSKVEVNYKIAKVIANALNWDIDFNAFKSAKQVIMIPLDNDKEALLKEANRLEPQRNEQDLFNEIEGHRRDVMLPAITEEKAGATGTGASEQFKVNENYPLKQPQTYPEVLLISYIDMQDTLEKKLGFKVNTNDTEQGSLELLELAGKQYLDKKTPFYSYIMVNIDDNKIVLDRFSRKLKEINTTYGITSDIKMYAFGSNKSSKLVEDVKKANFAFYSKPSTSQQLDVLRHMVPLDDAISRAGNIRTRGARGGALRLPLPASDNDDVMSTNSKMVRQNILDAKRNVIKAGKEQEVTLEQLRKEMFEQNKR
jgi:hypothetical protein